MYVNVKNQIHIWNLNKRSLNQLSREARYLFRSENIWDPDPECAVLVEKAWRSPGEQDDRLGMLRSCVEQGVRDLSGVVRETKIQGTEARDKEEAGKTREAAFRLYEFE